MAEAPKNGNSSSQLLGRRPSSSSDESPVHDMRIGPEYQATIPPLEINKRSVSRGPALVIWKPYTKLPEQKLMKYVEFSRTKFGYREEQSLGLLVCHRYNVDEANKDLVNFVPYPDDWTPLEKQTFEVGFQEHGKDFHKIKMMLPDKSVNNIVKFYYIWKKTRSKYQTIKNKMKSRRSNMDSDDDSYDDMNDHKNKRIRMGSSSLITSSFTQSQIPIIQALYNTNNGSGVCEPCTNCHRAQAVTLVTLKREHLLCLACSNYYQKYATMRPLFESAVVGTGETNEKEILSPPEDIDLSLESLKIVASPKDARNFLACLTNQIMTYNNKLLDQKLQYHKTKKELEKLNIEQYRAVVDKTTPSSKGWSDSEIELFRMSFTNYGKDFEAASIIVGNKTVSQCKSLYYSKRDVLDFDALLDEYDAKQMGTNGTKSDSTEEKSETKEFTEENEIQVIFDKSATKHVNGENKNRNSPENFVFNMSIGGITQPVRLQRVPIQLQGQNDSQEPMVIDLTDDDDDSRPAIELTISSEKKETSVKKVLDVIKIIDDDIQILGSNDIK